MVRILSLMMGTLFFFSLNVVASANYYDGYAKPKIDFNLVADQPGQLNFDVSEGAILKKGDVLAHITNTDNKIAVEKAKTAYERALLTHNQNILFFKKGTLSKVAFEKSKNDVKIAQLEFESRCSEKAVHTLEKLSDVEKYDSLQSMHPNTYLNRQFKTPVSAILTDKWVKDYNQVSKGEKIARLINIDHMELELFPSVKDLQKFQNQSKVTVYDKNNSKRSTHGWLSYFSPEIDAGTQTFKVKVQFDNLKSDKKTKLSERFYFLPGSLVGVKIEGTEG